MKKTLFVGTLFKSQFGDYGGQRPFGQGHERQQ